MQRKEAVVLLKDLLANCPFLGGTSVSLMPPDADDVISKGFQIHIRGASLDEESIACLKQVTKKHDVDTKQEDGLLIIYKSIR